MRQAGGRQGRRGIARVAAAVLAALLAVPVVIGPPSANADPRALGSSAAVSINVVSVSPSIPAPSNQLDKLSFELSISNTTNMQLNNVQITATRGYPLTSPHALTAAIAHPVVPTSGQPIAPVRPVSVDLPPAGEATPVKTTFVTTTAVPTDLDPGLCLCANGQVYPVWFQASGTLNGASQPLGQTQTFVPSFDRSQGPSPVQVSWVWPLIDRPHRLVGSTEFTDDALKASVSDGRLRRCLQVLDNVAGTAPVTVVIDPELLNELEFMATHKYTYRTASGHVAQGTGRTEAQRWLAQLQRVLTNNPRVSVVLTPNADPDVDSLARAGLTWSSTLPSAEQTRVLAALGGVTPSTGFAWPPSGTIARVTLRALYATGVRSMLLRTTSVQPDSDSSTAPMTLARLPNGGHPVVSALTTPQLSDYVSAAVENNSSGSGVPALMARLALAYGQQSTAGQQVFLVPPRYVDPAVSLATRAIERTSSSLLTRPANLLDVLATTAAAPLQQAPSAERARLVAPPPVSPGLPPANLRVARQVADWIPSLRKMFGGSAPAEGFVNQLNGGVQRIKSAAWRRGSGLGGRIRGVQFARHLQAEMLGVTSRVHIVAPASRTPRYTLASTNSPLPITVANDLPYPVRVRVSVRTVNEIPGLNAGHVGPQLIAPNSKATLHVPTNVQRSGLFRVYAILQTPDGRRIGQPEHLLVTSTALGTIGIVITVVSGAILVLALLIRFVRRLRTRRRQQPTPRRPWSPASADTAPPTPEEPVAPLTETLASPGAAPPPAAPGH